MTEDRRKAKPAEIRDSIFSKIFQHLEELDKINCDRDKAIAVLTGEIRDLATAVNQMRQDLNALIATLRGLGATAEIMGDNRRPPWNAPK